MTGAIPTYGVGDTAEIRHELDLPARETVSIDDDGGGDDETGGTTVHMKVTHHGSGATILETSTADPDGLDLDQQHPARVAYQFDSSETQQSGIYLFTFWVEFDDGRRLTSAPDRRIALRFA